MTESSECRHFELETAIREFSPLVSTVEPGLGEAFMRLMFLSRAFKSAIDASFAGHDLSNGRFAVLLMLRHCESGLQPSEVAERLRVSRATMTGLLDGLERSELLSREAHPVDRRSQVLQLTTKGQALLDEMLPVHGQRITELVGVLDPDECAALNALLKKLATGLAPKEPAARK